MKIRISVLMGIYNCADTLEEALDSIYRQTYKNFKIILCDDGSTDNTYDIAKIYASKYDNIILLRNDKNLKLAATLNKCLKLADTEFIARMDGDDISLPTRFKEQIEFLDNNKEYSVVSSPMIYFDESGDWGAGKVVEKPTVDSFKKGAPHPHAPCMVRTNVMKEVDGYTVAERTVRVEDYYLWYKIYNAGYKGANLPKHLYKMRDDRNALGRRNFKSRCNAFIVKMEVLNGLGFSNAFFYAFPSLIKGIIPSFIMRLIRRRKMKIN